MSVSRYKSILLFGAPGTGKGTQGHTLGTVPGYFHVSTGEVFRTLDHESEVGRVFHQYSSKGELVPDDVTVRMWDEFMGARVADGQFDPASNVLLLDGIPRSVRQAELLDAHIEVLAVLYLTCDRDEELVKRLRNRALTSNRPDDAEEEVIARRLEVYREETMPVLEHYSEDLVHEVNAIGTPGEVLQRILGHVVPLQRAAV